MCPSHIPLVQYFQHAMGQQDERRSAARKNDYIRQLTEARTERLAAEEAAKAAAKAAKAAAKAKPTKAAASSEVEKP
ncbi:electron transport complex protein RnfC [compost metagenome]